MAQRSGRDVGGWEWGSARGRGENLDEERLCLFILVARLLAVAVPQARFPFFPLLVRGRRIDRCEGCRQRDGKSSGRTVHIQCLTGCTAMRMSGLYRRCGCGCRGAAGCCTSRKTSSQALGLRAACETLISFKIGHRYVAVNKHHRPVRQVACCPLSKSAIGLYGGAL